MLAEQFGDFPVAPVLGHVQRCFAVAVAAVNVGAVGQEQGDGRIYGELKGLGYNVHWQTVRRVMKDHGLLDDADPEQKTCWKTFLASH